MCVRFCPETTYERKREMIDKVCRKCGSTHILGGEWIVRAGNGGILPSGARYIEKCPCCGMFAVLAMAIVGGKQTMVLQSA